MSKVQGLSHRGGNDRFGKRHTRLVKVEIQSCGFTVYPKMRHRVVTEGCREGIFLKKEFALNQYLATDSTSLERMY